MQDLQAAVISQVAPPTAGAGETYRSSIRAVPIWNVGRAGMCMAVRR